MQRLDGGLYIQFTIGDTGDLKILEMQNFTVGNTSETLNPKILNFYHSISKLFCEEKLYDLMCSYDDYFNTNKFLNNKKELAKLAMICKKIFLLQQKISEIEYNRVMRGSLLSIIKNDLGNDIKKDLSRLYFISDLDDFFLKRENL